METFTWLGKIDACNHTDSNLIRGCPFKGALCGAALLTLLCLSPLAASAGLIFLDLPGIDGGQSLPGFPGAIAVQSLEVMPGRLTIVKPVDSASRGPVLTLSLTTRPGIRTRHSEIRPFRSIPLAITTPRSAM